MTEDVLAEFAPQILAAETADAARRAADGSWSPWLRSGGGALTYNPDTELLRDLLSGPIADQASTQSGRLAKAFDAWLAYELRRAKFDASEVWPRNTSPRVSSREMEPVSAAVGDLTAWIVARDARADAAAERAERSGDPTAVAAAADRLAREHAKLERAYLKRQATHAKKAAEATAKGETLDALPALDLPARVAVQDALLPGLRGAVRDVERAMPNVNATNILGRFYVKQVDVVVSSWDRGPDVLISGKTMFSSFAKNTKNRYEETLGEATNLRDRYPLAAMGYAFLVSDTILQESGAYGRLQDLLLRTRKPDGPYDATMLLIASGDARSTPLQLTDPLTYPDPAVSQQQPPVELGAARFFTDLLDTVIRNTPVGIHQPVRNLRNGTPVPGGAPDPSIDADNNSSDDAGDE